MMEQNRLSHSARTIILLAILAVLAACEKPLLDDAAPTAVGGSPAEANVILRFTQYDSEAFARACPASGDKDGGDSDVTPVSPSPNKNNKVI